MKINTSHLFFFIALLLFLFSCKEEERKQNLPPETTFSIEEINLSGDNRLNSIVRLSWYGKDPDGYVRGFELSLDGQNWNFTTVQDSTFRFSISAGSDTTDINLFIRAVDNEDARDPTPDLIKIPIRNTAPTIEFSDDLTIPDTTYLVATTEWSADDVDGEETITQILISLNGAEWYEIRKSQAVFSIAPADGTVQDTTEAQVYYGTNNNPEPSLIKGLVMNDTNYILIKAVDQAGVESTVDTTNTFFMKGKTNDLLVVGGIAAVNEEYAELLDSANINYDFVDYAANIGENQPKLWNVTFRLLLLQYSKLIFYTDQTEFNNPYTGILSILLESAAASLQEFANQGGKYVVSARFDHDQNIQSLVGVLPIESVSTINYGAASLFTEDLNSFPPVTEDSLVESPLSTFPTLTASPFPTGNRISGVGCFNINTQDSEILYEAALADRRPNRPWMDTEIIASGRRVGGKLNQVFFTVQLNELNGRNNMDDLLNQIVNVEFN